MSRHQNKALEAADKAVSRALNNHMPPPGNGAIVIEVYFRCCQNVAKSRFEIVEIRCLCGSQRLFAIIRTRLQTPDLKQICFGNLCCGI